MIIEIITVSIFAIIMSITLGLALMSTVITHLRDDFKADIVAAVNVAINEPRTKVDSDADIVELLLFAAVDNFCTLRHININNRSDKWVNRLNILIMDEAYKQLNSDKVQHIL